MIWKEKKTGKWRAGFSYKKKKYQSKRFSKKSVAVQWEIDKRIELKKQEKRNSNNDQSILQVIDWFLRPDNHHGKRETTLKKLAFSLKHWRVYFAEKKLVYLSDLRRSHLSDYQLWRKKQITPRGTFPSNTTINHELKAIRQCFKKAEWDLEINNPFPVIKTIKIPKPDPPRYLSKEEIAIISQAAQKNSRKRSFYEIFTVLVYTGMRCGEACQLEVCDVNLDNQQIVLPAKKTKSSQPRIIPIGEKLKPFLANLVDKAKKANRTLLLLSLNGTPHKPDNVYKRFKSLLKKLEEQGEIARIEKINVHTLRKTYISHLVMKGVDPIKVMAIVGHKDFSTMKRYLHLSPKYRTDNVDVLDY